MFDFAFYFFCNNFLNKTNDQSCKKKVNGDKDFDTEGVLGKMETGKQSVMRTPAGPRG
jgi:hypothetical protein